MLKSCVRLLESSVARLLNRSFFRGQLLVKDSCHGLAKSAKECGKRSDGGIPNRVEWNSAKRVETLVRGRRKFSGTT